MLILLALCVGRRIKGEGQILKNIIQPKIKYFLKMMVYIAKNLILKNKPIFIDGFC